VLVAIFPSAAEADEILVGPDSVTWQRVSDVRMNLVMIYALLLQVAHPTVGAGVQDYSDFERRPWARLLRTLDYVTVLVYGGQLAIPAGRRLRERHRRFKGTRQDGRPYSALEPDAYAWVHATLINTYVVGHAHFGRPMTPDETLRFYDEYRRLGRLVGVRERDLPRTWRGFCDYFARMTREELVQTAAIDRVLTAIHRVPPPPGLAPELLWPAIRIPVAEVMRLGGVGPMSPALRHRLGINWSWHDEAAFRALGIACRGVGPILPGRLKVIGPGQLRPRSAAARPRPTGTRS
jgi:uncharacterized protein (DUF2236 family)